METIITEKDSILEYNQGRNDGFNNVLNEDNESVSYTDGYLSAKTQIKLDNFRDWYFNKYKANN